MTFFLTPEQLVKFETWFNSQDPTKNCGAIGGRFVYSFIPTSLGVITKVEDLLIKTEIDLTNYADW